MPFYSYHCKRCDRVHDAYRHVSQRHDSPLCCDEQTVLCIVPPTVQPDLPGYESPVTGKWVEGRSQRREDLRRSGCRPYEDPADERKEAARQAKYAEQASDAKLHESMMRAFYSMSEAKRRVLTKG